MGSPAQATQTNSQVYYDPDKGQYYTLEPQKNSMISWIDLIANPNGNRNYLGSSLQSISDRFSPKNTQATYPEMNMLFPALNAGLGQNIQNSLLGSENNQSSGAGRFLASSTSKGK